MRMNQNVIRNHKDSLFQLAFRDNPEAGKHSTTSTLSSYHTFETILLIS